MTDDSEVPKKEILLKGRENYLAWSTRLETMLTIDDIIKRDDDTDALEVVGQGDVKKKNEKTAKKYVVKNLSDAVMHTISPTDNFLKLLDKLNAAYGFANMDPSVIEAKLRTISFNPNKNPSVMLNQIDLWTAELESAGGSITDSQLVQLMVDGLTGDTFKDNFWFHCRGKMMLTGIKTYKSDTAGKFISKYWYAYKPVQITETANRAFEKRFCNKCKDANRTRIMKTHNTADCRISNENSNSASQVPATPNKKFSSYTALDLYHDSGTSSTMVNFQPKSISKSNLSIPIYTAGKNQPPELGVAKGVIHVGSIPVEAIYVPTFAKNLLSATQLSREYGCTQTIEPWTAKLKITQNDQLVATGTFDEATKLIKIDATESDSKNALHTSLENDWITVHRRMGHVGYQMMNKTLKASTGITLKNRFSVLSCEDCAVTKAKRVSVKDHQSTPRELLEVVETDIQGPFKTVAHDGTTYNLKFIDSKSGWLYFTTIPDGTANTTLDHFLKFQARIERQTGKKIKRVRTDGGAEYMKEFLAHLAAEGLIKEKGTAYTKHHPGKGERCHQTILRNGRTNHKQSKLPLHMYNESQKYSAYMFNRTVHGLDTITPYEHIIGRPPNLAKLQPFGCVCYAFIPPQKVHKLEDNGIRCRLLGYGDDFEVEETTGYRLIREDDGTIFYSDSVRFPKVAIFESLDEKFYSTETEPVGLDTDFQPTESEIDEYETFHDANDEFDDPGAELTEPEQIAHIASLLNETWWLMGHDPLKELHYAYKATTEGTPTSYTEAMSSPEAKLWQEAMDVEINALKENHTYDIIASNLADKVLKNRWVFKRKLNKDGSVARYKARLVAKGFLQRHGKDYFETFAPVAKAKSIRLLAIAAMRKQKVFHDDATSAFLNGILKERVVMEPAEGYTTQDERPDIDSRNFKWLLLKSLYGLKQAPREWNEVLHKFLLDYGFCQSKRDPCIYIKGKGQSQILLGVYVDDLISTGKDVNEVQAFRDSFKRRFKCSEGEELKWCLGLEVNQTDKGIYISQASYINQKLVEFEQYLEPNVQRKVPLVSNHQQLLIEAEKSEESDHSFPYREIVGSLMYAATMTRPDLSTAVGIVSRFLARPKKIHCTMVKQILYYLRRTAHYGLAYGSDGKEQLTGYVDASWANNEDYTSLYGFAFLFGDSLISWSSKKQKNVVLSSTESEYITITHGAQEALWFLELLAELGIEQTTVPLLEDNEASINMCKNPQEYKRTRHIQVRYHFVRDLVKDKKIELIHCGTKDQLADLFTKGVSSVRLSYLLPRLGMYLHSQPGRELNYARMQNDVHGSSGSSTG